MIERVDPTGRGHEAVVRLCPRNIRNGRVAPSPNGSLHFIRFQGLTDVADRYAEVLAHELAHARHILESPERVAETVAAQRVRAEFLGHGEHSLDRIPSELRERMRAAWAVLEKMEEQAEGVEAAVLSELVETGPATTAER